MPPANTPRTPISPQSPVLHRSLERLPSYEYLSEPVPDLAATLYSTNSQAADEADEANVTFLRSSPDFTGAGPGHRSTQQSHIDPQRDPRRTSPTAATIAAATPSGRDTPEDLSRRERLHRVLSRLNRLHETASGPSTTAYTNRTPSPSQQRLYDWAPQHNALVPHEEGELDAILSELRRQQPDTHPDILRVLSQSQLDDRRAVQMQEQREGHGASAAAAAAEAGGPNAPTTAAEAAERRDRLRERDRRRRESEWVSLRTRAAIQRSRQEFSPSATDRMLRYVMERERSGMSEEEERARGGGWFRPSPGRTEGDEQRTSASGSGEREGGTTLPPPPAAEARERERQERIEAFRRGYLAENVPPSRLPRISTPPAPPTASVPVPSTSPSPPSVLERALRYLSELRSCSGYEEALVTAVEHGLAGEESFADKNLDDFVMDLQPVGSIPQSSWLQPGTVFTGHQHAMNGCCVVQQQPTRAAAHSTVTHVVEQINPRFGPVSNATSYDHPPGSTRVAPAPAHFDASRPWLSHQFSPPLLQTTALLSKHTSSSDHDQWPVRVTLHAIDTDRMTLQGTMAAYDVPQHHPTSSVSLSSIISTNEQERPKAGKRHAPITTYLEGHIIDLTTHSFLTPEAHCSTKSSDHQQPTTSPTTPTDTIIFPSATPTTDATNWRALPPFSLLASDEEMASLLLSPTRLHDLNEQYIFMRWKERCFVHSKHESYTCTEAERGGDRDRGHGLTISGFYYVSLRRADGRVEGLYFDPGSTPVQRLRLGGVTTMGGWPAFGFR
ncbi:hypothetical protein BAUCODRAFT_161664 [Baudoinia panamericana UAMH 10762]|uniref:Vacuolar import and degradation protein-domain-containing protein n=1 Tax=Baudoinia panamericana (strain UAMH 10762) TaxID=717646 RepID=M2MTW4_BAUPA|nr:uncharacterized protein BAUCODRAFT_161664 [Baudoinia panamericana UAMH 10762]EMD00367.1 hypothetical protein BAUCODRAFT_161664 [Baudoinia panamericana UAMH 10762]